MCFSVFQEQQKRQNIRDIRRCLKYIHKTGGKSGAIKPRGYKFFTTQLVHRMSGIAVRSFTVAMQICRRMLGQRGWAFGRVVNIAVSHGCNAIQLETSTTAIPFSFINFCHDFLTDC